MQTSATIAKDYAGRAQASDFRKISTDILQPVEKYVVSGIKGDKEGQSESIDMFLNNFMNLEQEQMAVQQRYVEETLKNVQQVIQKSYDTPREINSNSKMEVTLKIDGDPNLVNKLDQNQLTNNITSIITEPNFVAQYRNTLLGGTAPSATVGGKNQP